MLVLLYLDILDDSNRYELEVAESYLRTKQWGPALKKFYAVKKHFNDFYDDLFDFHGYCVRKVLVLAISIITTTIIIIVRCIKQDPFFYF